MARFKTTNKTYSTIRVSTEFKKELDELKEENETHEDCIKKLIGGYKNKKITNIQREPIAFVLHYVGYDEYYNEIESYELPISFEDLKQSEAGEIYKPEEGNLVNYEMDMAEVIWVDEDNVLIKRTFLINDRRSSVLEDYSLY